VRTAFEVGMMTILLLLDFSNAFDSVRHEMLLPLVRSPRQTFWTGLEATWMVGCKRRDLTKQILLGKLLQRMCPKDRLLCIPLHFSIFINDMPTCLKFCRHHMFADDCQIYLSFSPNEVAWAVQGINTELRSVELWAERNGLKLNAQKTQMICTKTSR
jgi:hypothetical protein